MLKVKILTFDNLPEEIKQIEPPIKQLYYLGADPSTWLVKPRLAVVGSRKATGYGLNVIDTVIKPLAQAGTVIISGLAYGIDAAAHQIALEVGTLTVAVLGTPVDRIYPSAHQQLARRIVDSGGTILSEYPSHMPGLRHNFIIRNRLISGFSQAVLIAEAAINSGSLHTARFGLEQGKTVMAVPGDINKANAVGCNNLLKSGAVMVTEASDIAIALGLQLTTDTSQKRLRPEQARIYKLIQAGTTDQADLMAASQQTPAQLNNLLTELELSGDIKALGAGQWTTV